MVVGLESSVIDRLESVARIEYFQHSQYRISATPSIEYLPYPRFGERTLGNTARAIKGYQTPAPAASETLITFDVSEAEQGLSGALHATHCADSAGSVARMTLTGHQRDPAADVSEATRGL